MERKYIKIKEWMYDKVSQTAKSYNCYIDCFTRSEIGMIQADENGFVTVLVDEFLAESEKAIQVRLRTGMIDGSVKGWKCWLPKSCIAEEPNQTD